MPQAEMLVFERELLDARSLGDVPLWPPRDKEDVHGSASSGYA